MNVELFIARRIHFSNSADKKVSRPAVRIATIGIAIGLAVMIVAVSIVIGFKREIRNKVIGFGSHIQVTKLDANSTYETAPIAVSNDMIKTLSSLKEIKHVQRFSTKPGIIKTSAEFQGVVLKGVGNDFDWGFFKQNLIEGDVLHLTDNEINNGAVISKDLSKQLKLKLGDSFIAYFIQDNVRARKFVVKGIYSTNFGEFDKIFILTDIHHVQKLNDWKNDEITGLELLVNDYDHLNEATDAVFAHVANRFDNNGSSYYVQTIKELNPQIFSWLDLLDMNVWVILILMLAVAGFNMISGLLILILERTNMIGVLKSLGAADWSIRKIFLYQSFFLIGKGMIWGNIIGISICLVQYFTGIIKLDPEVYYIAQVPIALDISYLLLLNVLTFIVSVLMLVGPSYLITKISPVKSIRFE
jgi:lipoprotein-releasing system permease protein